MYLTMRTVWLLTACCLLVLAVPRPLTVVVCAAGVRSARAIESLKAAGYPGRLLNLEGGMRAWGSRRP